MSRGLGSVQRQILARLAENTAEPLDDWDNDFASWTSVTDLAGVTDHARVESARRAVIKLQDAGLVETRMVWREVPYWYPRWMRPRKTSRQMLVARLPIEGELRERWAENETAERQRLQKWIDKLVALDRGLDQVADGGAG